MLKDQRFDVTVFLHSELCSQVAKWAFAEIEQPGTVSVLCSIAGTVWTSSYR